jgi:hypothetical protein
MTDDKNLREIKERWRLPTSQTLNMDRWFNIDSLFQVSTTASAGETVAVREEIQRTVTRTKAFPRIWSIVGCVTEFVAGAFAVLYLIAALALGGAVLFFAFCH